LSNEYIDLTGFKTRRMLVPVTSERGERGSVVAKKLLQMLFLSVLALVALPGGAHALPGETTRVSVDSLGNQANHLNEEAALSGDGRYVAFHSTASNLVPGDTNDAGDVFVHDRQTATTERVSVASDGTEGNGRSGGAGRASLSADGRFVAFRSEASNLVPGDTNGARDIFVHDRQAGTTERVGVRHGGGWPAISADGRFVAFSSHASDLVPGDTNNRADVFVHDRQTGTTERVSVASDGSEADDGSYRVSVSADGRFVGFDSDASNLVDDDTNNTWDAFVHDRQTGTTERVSLASDGSGGNSGSYRPSLSADGHLVAFTSYASDLVPGDTNDDGDVFVYDRQAGTTERVSLASDGTEGNDASFDQLISADGRYVTFESLAHNLVSGNTFGTDIFVHDRHTGWTTLVSVASDGTAANSTSNSPSISADGSVVAFGSLATNLAAGDTNGARDMFVHELDFSASPPLPPPPLPEIELDVDMYTAGNTATSLDTLQSCNSIATVGGTLEIDVVVRDVPPYDSATDSGAVIAFQFNLLYDPTVVNVTADDPEMMLAAHPDSVFLDLSDPVPDADGDWLGAAIDLGDQQASGDGVLMRVTLEAVGEGTSTLDLDGVIVVAASASPYPIDSILSGELVVGGSCPDSDGDGFTDPEEGFVGTDVADDCPDNVADDAWPADLSAAEGYGKHDGAVNVLDVVQLTPPYFGSDRDPNGDGDFGDADPNYTTRKDFNGDNVVNIVDIVRVTPPMFGSTCAP
jgi:Tol biopolymer transport system component